MEKRKIFNYKGVKVNAFGLPVSMISKDESAGKLSGKSRVYHASFLSPYKKDAPKNLLVMYDIPHSLKKERDWFRRQLMRFGYVMIQKSVWIGPSPLPKNFLEYLKQIRINDKFKTLRLAKPYNSSISAMA